MRQKLRPFMNIQIHIIGSKFMAMIGFCLLWMPISCTYDNKYLVNSYLWDVYQENVQLSSILAITHGGWTLQSGGVSRGRPVINGDTLYIFVFLS